MSPTWRTAIWRPMTSPAQGGDGGWSEYSFSAGAGIAAWRGMRTRRQGGREARRQDDRGTECSVRAAWILIRSARDWISGMLEPLLGLPPSERRGLGGLQRLIRCAR